MNIISFAYTTPALLALAKTVTRRDWKPEHAAKFKRGMKCWAYDRSPRVGGHAVAVIRLIADPKFEAMVLVPDSDFEGEGFAWMAMHDPAGGRALGGEFFLRDPRGWFDWWRCTGGMRWTIRFEVTCMLRAYEPLNR